MVPNLFPILHRKDSEEGRILYTDIFTLKNHLSHQPFVHNYLVVNHHRNVVNDVHCLCPMILLS